MIPNILTSIRIILSPFIIAALIYGKTYLFLILLSIAALSDFFDGLLARMLNQKTVVGQLLDPLADKILIDSLYIALCLSDLLPIWLCSIVVGRDLILIIGISAGIAVKLSREPPLKKIGWKAIVILFKKYEPSFKKLSPSLVSKINTFFQIATILAVFIHTKYPFSGLNLFFYITSILTIVSMMHYAIRGIIWGIVKAD